jgi:hypothetical protein
MPSLWQGILELNKKKGWGIYFRVSTMRIPECSTAREQFFNTPKGSTIDYHHPKETVCMKC